MSYWPAIQLSGKQSSGVIRIISLLCFFNPSGASDMVGMAPYGRPNSCDLPHPPLKFRHEASSRASAVTTMASVELEVKVHKD